MANAIDKRTWLAERGLAKAGTRGKFSNDAKAALAEAEKNGVVFVDKKSVVSSVAIVDEDGNITSERREVNIYAPHPDPIREGRLTFVSKGSKMSVSVTEACSTCNYSFGWCYCQSPTFRNWKNGEVLTLAVNV